ncbi:MAG TPA: CbiX/SirB N-terminal domain-containing protein [Microlunatus sp.]
MLPGHSPVLIGIAHGSRHARVAEGVEAVLAATALLGQVETRAAYLDLTDPDLEAVAADLAAAGVRRAVVVPLLFTDAFHARIDVPDAVTRAAATSGIELVLAPILGTGDDVIEVVAERLAATGTAGTAPILLYAVGSSRPDANAAVADLAGRLAGRRGTPVLAGFGTTEPRAADVLAELRTLSPESGTVVPLFVAPGLLLDAITPAVAKAGWRLVDPLGTLLAPVVSNRYAAALGDQGRLR